MSMPIFNGRTSRVVEKLCSLPALPLAVAFGGVQQRGKTGAIELIADLAVDHVGGGLDLNQQ